MSEQSAHHSATRVAPISLDIVFGDGDTARILDTRSLLTSGDGEFGSAWQNRVTSLSVLFAGRQGPSKPAACLDDLLRVFESVREVQILIAGNPQPTVVSQSAEMRANCRSRGLRFSVAFVLDKRSDAIETLSGPSTSLAGQLESSRDLVAADVPVCWIIPVVPELVFRLEAIVSLAYDENVEPWLVPGDLACHWLGTAAPEPNDCELNDDESLFAWDFITYRMLEEETSRFSSSQRDYYRRLQKSLTTPANHDLMARNVVIAECTDTDRWRLELERRPALPWPDENPKMQKGLSQVVAGGIEIGNVLLDGFRALGQWCRAAMVGRAKPAQHDTESAMPCMVLIGAYGGDHIGDTAILGGVLLRLHRQFTTTRAILMSQRPEHTRHLVGMLDVPVSVDVEPYEHPQIRSSVKQADGLVFAGGPMTDIPKQLVRHLYAVSLARVQGKTFIAEGIGAGPFVRRASAWFGRRIVKMASRVCVRTSTDAQQPVVHGIPVEVGRDPAFDYLETRVPDSIALSTEEYQAFDELLQDTTGHQLIGINLRPIRHLYTEPESQTDRVQHTRSIESRFEERFAEGLRQFSATSPIRPCFIFFPMNAIQFGMSDLRSAYRIARLLGNAVDFRVWQADASIDGIMSLLRRLDIAVTMRFHATIYALSAGIPTIGIDYRIGKRDKVDFLLSDLDQAENCTRIDLFSAEWLCERLRVLTNSLKTA